MKTKHYVLKVSRELYKAFSGQNKGFSDPKEQIAIEVIQRKEYWNNGDRESTAYSGSLATPRERAPMEMTSDTPSPSPSPIKHGHRSQLLNQIRGQKSIGRINVFGTGESLQYDLRAGSVSFDSANGESRIGQSSPDSGDLDVQVVK